jgi:hypothetical protein
MTRQSRAKKEAVTAWKKVILTLGVGGLLSVLFFPALPVSVAVAGYFVLRRKPEGGVPVLMYHSVTDDPGWMFYGREAAISIRQFEKQLRYFHDLQYRSLFVSEYYSLRSERKCDLTHKNCVVITFDDAYYDNYKNVYPLLVRYKIKVTIFVTPQFIRDQNRKIDPEDERLIRGYCSWKQMQEMKASGLVEFQSHGLTHARHFVDNIPQNYHHPGYSNGWLFWNAFPEKKPDWWKEDLSAFGGYGMPIYKMRSVLASRRFYTDTELTEEIISWVKENVDNSFWENDWKAILNEKYRLLLSERGVRAGFFESEGDYLYRITCELMESKRILEEMLGGEIRFLCWPENEFTEQGHYVALNCGYLGTVSLYHDTMNGKDGLPDRIGRIYPRAESSGFKSEQFDYLFFKAYLSCAEGKPLLLPVILLADILRKVSGLTKSFQPGAPTPFPIYD